MKREEGFQMIKITATSEFWGHLLIFLFGTGFLAIKRPTQQEFHFLNKRIFTQRPSRAIGFFQYGYFPVIDIGG